MDLYLQLGHGMMSYCEELISKWCEGTVILSPRDLTEEQTNKFSERINSINGRILFDPQYYNPRADHYKLNTWRHWPNDYDTSAFFDKNRLSSIFGDIKEINDCCKSIAYIIPSILCDDIEKRWIAMQELFIDISKNILNDKDRYITLALSSDIIKDEKSIEMIIELSTKWDVDGYYIVPEGRYLENDSYWLVNLAQLVAGLKLQNKKVIVGYSSHQMLSLACANVDAIASGTFLNVRSFDPKKFNNPDTDTTKRKAVWYYCPQTMSEYGNRALDRAYDYKILEKLKPFGETNEYIDILFSGSKPSTVKFGDSLSFRHYLDTLKKQCLIAKKDTFQNTIDYHKKLCDNAYMQILQLDKEGVRESQRNFKDIADIYQDTLFKLDRERGALLKRAW